MALGHFKLSRPDRWITICIPPKIPVCLSLNLTTPLCFGNEDCSIMDNASFSVKSGHAVFEFFGSLFLGQEAKTVNSPRKLPKANAGPCACSGG
jgi:hypothetical protein